MRLIAGLLLAALWLHAENATGSEQDTTVLASMAGVPIRIFDLHADGVSDAFRAFMQTVPMTNDRQVPGRLIDDTVASLAFLKAATPPGVPSYFVAAYIHKTALVRMSPDERAHYLGRYGEAVYPQQVCPVFISRTGSSVPELLSVATNLPAAWFDRTQGAPEVYARLFALTEASHCGFIARELANPTILPAGLGQEDLRTILEALGDFEATAALRAATPPGASADEADTLFAARLLAMFLVARENAYTALPALVHEYGRVGPAPAHHRLPEIRRSVHLARDAVRRALLNGRSNLRGLSLPELADRLARARDRGELELSDRLASDLVALLGPALSLLDGDHSIRLFPTQLENARPARFVTLALPIQG